MSNKQISNIPSTTTVENTYHGSLNDVCDGDVVPVRTPSGVRATVVHRDIHEESMDGVGNPIHSHHSRGVIQTMALRDGDVHREVATLSFNATASINGVGNNVNSSSHEVRKTTFNDISSNDVRDHDVHRDVATHSSGDVRKTMFNDISSNAFQHRDVHREVARIHSMPTRYEFNDTSSNDVRDHDVHRDIATHSSGDIRKTTFHRDVATHSFNATASIDGVENTVKSSLSGDVQNNTFNDISSSDGVGNTVDSSTSDGCFKPTVRSFKDVTSATNYLTVDGQTDSHSKMDSDSLPKMDFCHTFASKDGVSSMRSRAASSAWINKLSSPHMSRKATRHHRKRKMKKMEKQSNRLAIIGPMDKRTLLSLK